MTCLWKRTLALGILASSLLASAHQARAASQSDLQKSDQKKPGVLTQFFDQLATNLAAAKPDPALKLTSNPSNPIPGQLVTVTAAWNQPVSHASYAFNWGDGSPSVPGPSAQSQHAYNTSHTFHVIVTARTVIRDKAVEISQTLNIEVSAASNSGIKAPPPPPPPPVVTLIPSVRSTLPNREIVFRVSATPSDATDQYRFSWDSSHSEIGPSGIRHAYSSTGNFFPYVTLISVEGVPVASSQPVEINISASDPDPTLALKCLSSHPITGSATSVLASLDPPQPNARYSFNWGDSSPVGPVSGLSEAMHAYRESGVYTIKATAFVSRPGRKQYTVTQTLDLQVFESASSWKIPGEILAVLSLLATGTLVYCRIMTSRLHAQLHADPRFDTTIAVTGSGLSITFVPGADPPEHRFRLL